MPAKIEMAFPQTLAIRGWFNKLHYFPDQKPQTGKTPQKIEIDLKFTTTDISNFDKRWSFCVFLISLLLYRKFVKPSDEFDKSQEINQAILQENEKLNATSKIVWLHCAQSNV